ncbi:MAG: amidase [Sandaracinaceae bacterium]
MFELPAAPRLTGAVLRSVVAATSAEPVRRALAAFMRKDLGIEAARALPASQRGEIAPHIRPMKARDRHSTVDGGLEAPTSPTAIGDARSWQAKYRDGSATPVEVIERVFAEARRLEGATPTMACLCTPDVDNALRDAEASAARWANGEPLGPLDGVAVPIKEEVNLEGIGYRLGTDFVDGEDDVHDGTVVHRLRAAGAIIVGHTPMTEMGMSPLGVNVHRKMPRNAHAADRAPGGSSTGSAIAVASGLAPLALGTDGGGSIRIPAALNGVFGIKPTFGRVSRHGDGFGGTVDHLGPIGASTHDLAIFLEAVSGPDPEDWLTHDTESFAPGALVSALGRGVEGLRIGVLRDEWADATDAVQSACSEALSALSADGATLVDVSLPLARHAAGIGYMTIGLETHAALLEARRHHWDRIGPSLQLLMRMLSTFDADDYLDAQALRQRLRVSTAELLREVDVLVLPTTAAAAVKVSDQDMLQGFADTPALADVCRYAFLGNLTGLPCATAPVGSGAADLPVGLQVIGDAFDEATVLSVLAQLERNGVAEVRAPRIPVSPLGR